jgi:hypothetical protein
VFLLAHKIFRKVDRTMLLIPDDFKKYFETFNKHDEESVIQHVDNASAWEWIRDQIPLFHCPDNCLEETCLHPRVIGLVLGSCT